MFFRKEPLAEGVEKKKSLKWLWFSVAIFILADILVASFFIFEEVYKNRIYPGVSVSSVYVGGMRAEDAQRILNARVNQINQDGLKFKVDNDEMTVYPIVSSLSGDVTKELVSFDVYDTISEAYSVGRDNNFFKGLKEKIALFFNHKKIGLSFFVDNAEIKKILEAKFFPYEQPGSDAVLFATTTPNYWKKEIIFRIAEEKPGFRFDYDKAISDMTSLVAVLDGSKEILIGKTEEYPDIKKNECQNIEVKAQQFLESADLLLYFEKQEWRPTKDDIASWLTLSRGTENKIVLDFDRYKVGNYLSNKVASDINIKPTDARFEIKDNRVIEFASSADGRAVDVDGTISRLRTGFLAGTSTKIEIAVSPVKSGVRTENINQLGVKEKIGTGHSNFSGSPKNRIHNIKTGAAAINGTLVPPGEEFSTNKTLGEITAETGYLPEMTIKGDKTVPEYGGGLCQVGTTLFRSAIESGLPVTARRPHSYRVSYYEPAGTDAAIYGPWPDLRFLNDTGNYILIQSRIDGNDIYFDFWGTKDGRVMEKTDPTVYNIVKPPATKIIETTDLEPGKKKCTERSHNGADAYFDYKVTYADGTVKSERFKSHYVPWQEVCLIGVDKKSTTTAETAQ